MNKRLCAVVGLCGSLAFATGNDYFEKFLAEPAFNGIAPKEVGRFWENWHLVTTRYRKDNGQIRFVFANDVAWQTFKDKKATFSDGAILAKVAYFSKPDANFDASAVPTDLERIQVMKKDSRTYAATAGWGYAVFRDQNLMHAISEKTTVTACYSCHTLVKKTYYTFSRPVFVGVGESVAAHNDFADQFLPTAYKILSPFAQRAVQYVARFRKPETVMVASMALFTGSLWESVGTLSSLAQKTGALYLLYNQSSRQFVGVEPRKPTAACKQLSLFGLGASFGRRTNLRHGTVCDGKIVSGRRSGG